MGNGIVFENVLERFLPYIKYTAYKLSKNIPNHITTDDLTSVGFVGLMDAVNRFNPEKKAKLKTYAELRIKGAMIDELRATAWIPRSMRKKIEGINNARMKLEKKHGRKPDDIEVAKSMKMSLKEYFKILQYSTCSNHVRLEDFVSDEHTDSDLDITECLADTTTKSPLEILEERDEFNALISSLSYKEKMVLVLFHRREFSVEEIGALLKITGSAVSLKKKAAVQKIKKKLNRKDFIRKISV